MPLQSAPPGAAEILDKTFKILHNIRMKSETWWDHFNEDPYEKIGRYVAGAFGRPIIVYLSRISWAYLDWLEEEEACDVQQFFIDNDAIRLESDGCLHAWMEGAVKTGYLRRERKGLPRPSWCPPANPAEFVDI